MFYSTLKQNGMTLSDTDKIQEQKQIRIGNDVFIGANVTILDGLTIGDGAVIGAGAVISKDIPPYAIAVGCPVHILKYRFESDTIDKLLKIKWWEFEDTKLKDVERMFFDVNKFIEKYYSK
jgi:acetyltransferase-like isoleucine patch superfamily enzyme